MVDDKKGKNMAENKDWLLVGDVARILGVSSATVRLYADSGRLPSTRTEKGTRLFSRPDVERFAAQRQEYLASRFTWEKTDPTD
jgi:excisionase family DNA binding protein